MSHSHGSSSSDSSEGSDSMAMMMMMKPYLHFTSGDVVLFESIAPRSSGAIVGACLVTFVLAIFSRYVAAAARGFQYRCAIRAKTLLYSQESSENTKVEKLLSTSTKFYLSHELARSLIVGLEILLHYALMLIAMTFNAAYIFSIILGAMLGEFGFGRLHRISP